MSSPWQKPTLFFKVGKQLKTLITKSVQTVADFRIRSLGSQKGYGFLISLVFSLISHTACHLSVLSWIETQQVTLVFHFKPAPLHLKNLEFLKRGLCACPSQGLAVLLQHWWFPVLLKPTHF